MNKSEAVEKFGKDVVEEARDMYETDFGKVLFEEDCKIEGDYPLNENERDEYLHRANMIINHRNRATTIIGLLQTCEG